MASATFLYGLAVLANYYILLLFNHHLLRQNKIENYGKKEYHCHAVLGKHCAYYLWENGEHTCCLGKAKTNTKRQANNNHIALRESSTRHHTKSSKENAAEHHYCTTAKNCLRNSGKSGTNNWEHTTNNHNNCSNANGKAVYNT